MARVGDLDGTAARRPPRRSSRRWSVGASVVLVALFLDAVALTWYLWMLPPGRFDDLHKKVTTAAGWVAALLAYFGVRHLIRRQAPLRKILSSLPVVLLTVAMSLLVWFFVLPFHSVQLLVLGDNQMPLGGATVMLTGEAGQRPGVSDQHGKLAVRSLLATSHRVEVSHPFYDAPPVTVPFGDVLRFWGATPVTLKRTQGKLVLMSTPPGARVFIDGKDAGQTPLTRSLDAGEHKLRLEAGSDFERYEAEVRVSKGDETRIEAPLRRKPRPAGPVYDVLINSYPNGATVFIDGKAWGATNLTVKLPQGTHQVVLRLAGYPDHQEAVTIPGRSIVAHTFVK